MPPPRSASGQGKDKGGSGRLTLSSQGPKWGPRDGASISAHISWALFAWLASTTIWALYEGRVLSRKRARLRRPHSATFAPGARSPIQPPLLPYAGTLAIRMGLGKLAAALVWQVGEAEAEAFCLIKAGRAFLFSPHGPCTALAFFTQCVHPLFADLIGDFFLTAT